MSSADKRALLALEAARRVADVRDDPHGRRALAEESYVSATNTSLERYSRAELAFIDWEIKRGVLHPVKSAGDGGSPWWRTINQTLLRDCAEGSLLHRDGFTTGGTNGAVDLWLRFFASPTPDNWYRAHNASIVSGYLTSSGLAAAETEAERLLMNLILTRALYAYLLAVGQARIGWLERIGRWLANPAGIGIVAVIDMPGFYPATYPMSDEDAAQLQGVGFEPDSLIGKLANLLIFSDIKRVFQWNAEKIGLPALCDLTTDSAPCYPLGEPVIAEKVAGGAKLLRQLDDTFDAIAATLTPDDMLERLPWVAGVSLQDVCFVSWEVPPNKIEPLLPRSLKLDTFEGKSYITAVALRAEQMHFRGLPPMHDAAVYYELNFRTYVQHHGERGIFFISVDGTPGGAFDYLARFMFRIPYYRSVMDMHDADPITFSSNRKDDDPSGTFELSYSIDPTEPAKPPEPGSLEEFICVRDLAFSRLLGVTMQLEVRHPLWTLQPVTSAKVDAAALFGSAGVSAPTGEPSVFYSPRSDGVMLLPVPA
jgi:uncharacterized protein YqjF (DUF2071 family)